MFPIYSPEQIKLSLGPISHSVYELIIEISCALITIHMFQSGNKFAHVRTTELSWYICKIVAGSGKSNMNVYNMGPFPCGPFY